MLIFISFHRCTYHRNAFGPGETKELECIQPETGRYVFVMLKVKEFLTLCEVKVFADRGMLSFPSYVCRCSNIYCCMYKSQAILFSFYVETGKGKHVLPIF